MPTTSPQLPPIPPPTIPLYDVKTGSWSKIWYDYMRALDQVLRKVRSEIP